jgi:hypothetical protein
MRTEPVAAEAAHSPEAQTTITADPTDATAMRLAAAGQDLLARLAHAPVRDRALVLARLQSSIGNARVARRLSPAGRLVQRDELDDPDGDALDPDLDPADAIELQQAAKQVQAQAAPAAPAPAARPGLTTLTNNCADCNAAVAILNAGTYVGEANVQATAGGQAQINTTKTKKGWVASIALSWSIDVASSTMEVTDFVWPNMTAADTAAVAAFKSALLAHEEGHFLAVEAAIAKLPKTITATGATEAKAVAALKVKVPKETAKADAAIKKADADYEAKTNHGKTQSSVGGTDVHLTCPGPNPVPPPGTAPGTAPGQAPAPTP